MGSTGCGAAPCGFGLWLIYSLLWLMSLTQKSLRMDIDLQFGKRKFFFGDRLKLNGLITVK